MDARDPTNPYKDLPFTKYLRNASRHLTHMKLHHDNWWCLLGQLWGFVRYCKKWCEIVRNSRTNLGTPWGLARHLGTAAKSHQTSRYFETCPTIFLLWLSEIVRNCENWWDMYHGVQANMFSCRQCKSSKSKTDLVIFISRWYTSTLPAPDTMLQSRALFFISARSTIPPISNSSLLVTDWIIQYIENVGLWILYWW